MCLFSFAQDNWQPLYRHRATGALLPVHCDGAVRPMRSFLDRTAEECRIPADLWTYLHDHFEFVGGTPDQLFVETIREMMARASAETQLVFLLGNELNLTPGDRKVCPAPGMIARNRLVREAAGSDPRVHHFRISDYAEATDGPVGGHHFDRAVYHRLSMAILEAIEPVLATSVPADAAPAEAPVVHIPAAAPGAPPQSWLGHLAARLRMFGGTRASAYGRA